MTAKRLSDFNRAVDMLYRREHLNATIEEVANRYAISTQRAGKILTKARGDAKIVRAVAIMKRQMEFEFERDNPCT